MKITGENGKYIIKAIGEFDADAIFTSGQSFRWTKQGEYWTGISLDKTAKVKTIDDGIELLCKECDLEYWIDFLDDIIF